MPNINIVLSSGGLFSRYIALKVIEEHKDEQLVLLHALGKDKELNKINIDSVYHTQELIHEKYGLTPMVITTSYDYDINNFTLDTVSLLTSVFSKYVKSDDTVLGNIFSNHYKIFTGVTLFNTLEKTKADLESNMECVSSAMSAIGIDLNMSAPLYLLYYNTERVVALISESMQEAFSYPISIGKDAITNIFMGYINGDYNLDDKFIKSIFNNGKGMEYLNDILVKIFELTGESFIKIPFMYDFVNSSAKQEKKQQKSKKESTTVLKKKGNVSSDSITAPPSSNKISNIELPKIEPVTTLEPSSIKYDANNGTLYNEEFTEDIIEAWMNKEISGDVAADKLKISIHDFYSLARKYKAKK